MKHVTEIILATLIVGCLIALIVILTNSCKNADFSLKQSFSTPTKTIKNLAFFADGENTQTALLIDSLIKNGIKADQIILAGPMNNNTDNYSNFSKLNQISKNILFSRLVTKDDAELTYCLTHTTPNSPWGEILASYKQKINNIFPTGIPGMKYGGICCTSEDEGKISCNEKVINSKKYFLGTWRALYPNDKACSMAGGPGPQWSNYSETLFSNICNNFSIQPGSKIPSTDWFSEKTYEPYNIKGGNNATTCSPCPVIPNTCSPKCSKDDICVCGVCTTVNKNIDQNKTGRSCGTTTCIKNEKCVSVGCCDTITPCNTNLTKQMQDNTPHLCAVPNTTCTMESASGWGELMIKQYPPSPPKKGQENQYITIGLTRSNADCTFNKPDTVTDAIKFLLDNNVKSICIYARQG